MKKILLLTLFVSVTFNVFCQLSDDYQPTERQKLHDQRKQYAGFHLRQAGILMYSSIGVAGIATAVYTLSNQSTTDKIANAQKGDDTQSFKDQQDFYNGVSYGLYGVAALFDLIAIGKIIKSGNMLEAEEAANKKNVSLKTNGNSITLAYRF